MNMIAHCITASRLGIAGAFAVVVAAGGRAGAPSAGATAALIALALAAELTDLLDGWAARRFGTAGAVGGILDPLADSLARLMMYFAAALAGWVTIAVPLVMAGRDILAAYARVVQAMTGGQTAARWSGKVKAVAQGVGIVAIVLVAGLRGRLGEDLRIWLVWAVAGVVLAATAWSLADYVAAAAGGLRRLADGRNDSANSHWPAG